MNIVRRRLLAWLACFVLAPSAFAHVGSKDVYENVTAGPYRLLVTVRTPVVIPGEATVEVTSIGAPVSAVSVTATPMVGDGSQIPPEPEKLERLSVAREGYSGSFWLMRPGSWRLRFAITGAAGAATTAIAVPAMPLSVLPMSRGLSTLLVALALFLLISLIAIAIAAFRESRLAPGLKPVGRLWRGSLTAGAAVLVCGATVAIAGGHWWKASAAASLGQLYRPIALHPVLVGNLLDLQLAMPGGAEDRVLSDFIPDHGHLMHLYVIRRPGMDVLYHLHPQQLSGNDFHLALPSMPPGTYSLYGDVVHANGFPETVTAHLVIPPGLKGRALVGDDALGTPPSISKGFLGDRYRFQDGYSMVWDRPKNIKANVAYRFRFQLRDAGDAPAADMEPYMGMVGHAAFVKTDGTVFAHVHPEGSASMAAMMLANQAQGSPAIAGGMAMETAAADAPTPSEVAFPYGFPSPGRYRIFVQMKHATTVETGAFDVEAH